MLILAIKDHKLVLADIDKKYKNNEIIISTNSRRPTDDISLIENIEGHILTIDETKDMLVIIGKNGITGTILELRKEKK